MLVVNSKKWNGQWRRLRERHPGATFNWYRTGGRSARDWILPALRRMTQAHCAFCDTFPMEIPSAESIEHFRPKYDPRFYGQAYAWGNLYYCCDECQENKGAKWDDGLLRPDAADYSFNAYFIFNFRDGEIRPNPAATPLDQARAKVTVDFYGLDSVVHRRYRKLELNKWIESSMHIDNFSYRDYLDG